MHYLLFYYAQMYAFPLWSGHLMIQAFITKRFVADPFCKYVIHYRTQCGQASSWEGDNRENL